MKHFIFFAATLVVSLSAFASRVVVKQTAEGGLSSITVEGDTTAMNWIIQTDGTQYGWIDAQWQWGLGSLKIDGENHQWLEADKAFSGKAVFKISNTLTLTVLRKQQGDDFIETYSFRNIGSKPVSLTDIDVNTPFNDNYPDAQTCINRRCHAHVWASGTASYVCAIRMGAYAPHIGLMLTKGTLEGYSIKERGRDKGSSNTRGVICLNPADTTLAPGRTYTFSWRLFSHDGLQDFYTEMKKRGGLQCSADRYVAQTGEKVTMTCATAKKTDTMVIAIDKTGDIRVPVKWNGGETWVELFGISNYEKFIERRANFIIDHQQYDNADDKRDGALLPYDNNKDSLFFNWLMPRNWSDANEGRERVGGGIFLAYIAAETHSEKYLEALKKYCLFVRNQLQDSNFDTWSDADKALSRISSANQRHRIYNYSWITHLYCQTFEATKDISYLHWAYGTQMACYRDGGYNFYCIDVPVTQSIALMKENGMTAQADTLLSEYRKVAKHYMANGLNYPKFEVNYEQSIVAPTIDFLCQMYLVTKEKQYFEAAHKMMPVLEAFAGVQPSCHLHDISIRHWDGYWFGKPQQWGDTMPHYWSCITADCFAYYSLCLYDINPTLSDDYMNRALAILRQNLCLFTEDGRGGAAYIYPTRVDGIPAHGLNPFSNDQDFALMYYKKLYRRN